MNVPPDVLPDLPPERIPARVAWRMALRSLRKYHTARGFWPTREQLASYDRRRSPEWWRAMLEALRVAGAVSRWRETPAERDVRVKHQTRRRKSLRVSRRSYRYCLVDDVADGMLATTGRFAPRLAPRLAPHRPDVDTLPMFEEQADAR